MGNFIALLRGINVSGQKQIKMVDLKALFEVLGFSNVQTYIQSGNVIFSYNDSQTKNLEKLIEKKILGEYGFQVPAIVLKSEEWNTILHSNPFLKERENETEKLYLTILSDIPLPENLKQLPVDEFAPDTFVIDGKKIYLYLPNGYGRTKLNNNYFENKLKVTATTRNWKTVKKLSEFFNE